jgi:hypothetical protein
MPSGRSVGQRLRRRGEQFAGRAAVEIGPDVGGVSMKRYAI